jgi:hypothetical protein
LLLGSFALWACSGNDTGTISNAKLEADASSDDATMSGDEGAADAAEEPLPDATLLGDEGSADAAEEPAIVAEPDADGGDADVDSGDADADVDSGDGDADVDSGDGGSDVDSGDGSADVDTGDAEGGDADAEGGNADADADAPCVADLDATVDGGLSTTAQIIDNLQGDACQQCAAMYCLDPASTCESFGCQVATAGPASGTLKKTLCYQTLSCLLTPTGNPIPCYDQGNGPQSCYCGLENSATCETAGPTATAECAAQEQAADESAVSATVLARLTDPSFAGGVANNLMDCLSNNCLDCVQ